MTTSAGDTTPEVLDEAHREALEMMVARMRAAGVECHVDAHGLHRDGGPAIVYPDGREEWYQRGVRHRDGGPAICGGAVQAWYRAGERHRDDGPAYVTSDGRQEWFVHGVRHRTDGPAVCDPNDGDEWYVDGEQVSPFDDRIIGVDGAPGTSLSDTFF